MTSVFCGDCGAVMELKRSPRFGLFFGCTRYPDCKGTHAAHQATGEPMGYPANAETRAARRRAHAAFDAWWRAAGMSHGAAYRWMQQALGLTREAAHISRFDVEACGRLIAAVEQAQHPARSQREEE